MVTAKVILPVVAPPMIVILPELSEAVVMPPEPVNRTVLPDVTGVNVESSASTFNVNVAAATAELTNAVEANPVTAEFTNDVVANPAVAGSAATVEFT